MRILDLFCGEGGSAVGYYRGGAGIIASIEGVDHRLQKRYPFKFFLGDALDYLRCYGKDFDFIHASPPCQRYSRATPNKHKEEHPDLIAETRELLLETGLPFVIENVSGARKELQYPVMLCGSMLGKKYWRHRYFEIYPPLPFVTPACDHSFKPVLITDHGGPNANGPGKSRQRTPVAVKREAAEALWCSSEGISQIVPPAYTEFLFKLIFGFVQPPISSSHSGENVLSYS